MLKRVAEVSALTIGLLALFVADAVGLEIGDRLLARGRHDGLWLFGAPTQFARRRLFAC